MSEKAEKKPGSADKGEKKDAGKEAAAPAKAKGGGAAGLMGKTPVLLGGVMFLEALVLIGGFKFLNGGPKSAGADVVLEGKDGDKGKKSSDDKKTSVEVQLVDFRAPNKVSGKMILYDVQICVSTKADNAETVKALISGQDALIKDRVRTIIAELDPEKLGGGSEPGLETLRRQIKVQLEQIIGEGLIDEVLVPRCIPFRTDN